MATAYFEKLQDVRWQKLRLKIMERDDWKCVECSAAGDGVTLHVHHRIYRRGHEPWDYDPRELVTACGDCHERYEEVRANLQELFFSRSNLHDLEELYYALAGVTNPDHCPAALADILNGFAAYEAAGEAEKLQAHHG